MGCSFVYSNGTLTLILKGKPVVISPDHVSYGQIKSALKDSSEDELLALCDVKLATKKYVSQDTSGKATINENDEVCYEGQPIHNSIAVKVREFMVEGLPFDSLLRFLERVNLNPSFTARNELFDFLQHKNLPITQDGCFLAYKAVRSDFKDKYTGTITNSLNTVVEIPRNTCDDNRLRECSEGLHAGALDYVYQYGNQSTNDRILLVKVDPADVVAVPKDYNFQKLRTCRYEVISEFDGALERPLYTPKAEPVPSPVNDESYDWSWADSQDNDYNSHDPYDEDEYDDEDEDEYDEDEEFDPYDEDETYDEDDEEEDDGCCDNPDCVICYGDNKQEEPVKDPNIYKTKPDGKKYYAVKDEKGRWVKKFQDDLPF